MFQDLKLWFFCFGGRYSANKFLFMYFQVEKSYIYFIFSSVNDLMVVRKKWKRRFFALKLQFLNTMTFCKDHVGIDFPSRLGSNYAWRTGKSLGARGISKWPKWAQPSLQLSIIMLACKSAMKRFAASCYIFHKITEGQWRCFPLSRLLHIDIIIILKGPKLTWEWIFNNQNELFALFAWNWQIAAICCKFML